MTTTSRRTHSSTRREPPPEQECRLSSGQRDVIAKRRAFPEEREAEREARALITRLRNGDAWAAEAAMRLLDALEALSNGPLRRFLPTVPDETRAGWLSGVAHELQRAVARLESDDPRAIAAKARLVSLWAECGEPNYVEELCRTLEAGAARLVERMRIHA